MVYVGIKGIGSFFHKWFCLEQGTVGGGAGSGIASQYYKLQKICYSSRLKLSITRDCEK